MTADLITEWEFECACGFSFVMPMLADDPTGEYPLSVAMSHLIECEEETP